MFIAQAFKYDHEWWRYLVGVIIIFAASQIGSVPFLLAAMFEVMQNGGSIADLEDINVLMSVLDSNLTFFLMLLSFAIGLLAVFFVVKYLHRQPFLKVTTSRGKMDWGRFWFGFLLIAGVTIVLTVADYYSNPQDYELQFNLVPFLILAVIGIIMVPLQTSFEEYLFRGYLMQGLGVIVGNKWFPLFVTSLVFGGLHFFNPEVDKIGNIIMFYYIGTGLFLGIITLMDEGMELALGFHAGNNLVGALLVTADWTVFRTNSVLLDISEPSAGFDVLGPVFVIYPIFIGIMAFKYKWTNWGEKLFGKVIKPEEIIENPSL
ncbi:CPBP family intramembrane glutamic endopeptidase [Ulvibacter antarcticus]|uniref:CAAX prenyl protease 2/Lysostaphin resistance protein A-like domain-containing protein n=1 Tax=Ulvibacter antarcticus TaxID=442714 RepID=A0A3L9YHI9_9FLAO|nr:CPBP family intramembrane glutamic endopeptidase [Ulvibacter antarcticus]RMA58659.1 hypothetical protein BXY75_2033 [Ulvibacter antarcticus]